MEAELQEYRAWLYRCEKILAGRTEDEVADLAIAAGFSRLVVAQEMTTRRFHGLDTKEVA